MKYATSQDMFLLLTVAVFAGILNFTWEWAHMGLYGEHAVETVGVFVMSIWATAGDVMYVIGAVLLASLFKKNVTWIRTPNIFDVIGLAGIGIGIALFVEYKALTFQTWSYLEAMPIIPWLEVGLSPIVQMTTLLPLSVVLTALFWKHIHKQKSEPEV